MAPAPLGASLCELYMPGFAVTGAGHERRSPTLAPDSLDAHLGDALADADKPLDDSHRNGRQASPLEWLTHEVSPLGIKTRIPEKWTDRPNINFANGG